MEQTPPPPIEDLLTKDCIAFDLETVANKKTLAIPGVMPEFEAAKNLKDPIKIEASIAEKREKFIEEAGLDPNYGQIVCIALCNSSVEHVFTGGEKDILKATWDVLKDWREICGYNSKLFDYNFMVRRSWFLGIKPSVTYDTFPYRSVSHFDIRLILSNGNKTSPGKLATYAKLKFGVDMDAKGSEVQGLWDEGKIKEIADHCLQDVKITWALFKSLQGFYI